MNSLQYSVQKYFSKLKTDLKSKTSVAEKNIAIHYLQARSSKTSFSIIF